MVIFLPFNWPTWSSNALWNSFYVSALWMKVTANNFLPNCILSNKCKMYRSLLELQTRLQWRTGGSCTSLMNSSMQKNKKKEKGKKKKKKAIRVNVIQQWPYTQPSYIQPGATVRSLHIHLVLTPGSVFYWRNHGYRTSISCNKSYWSGSLLWGIISSSL